MFGGIKESVEAGVEQFADQFEKTPAGWTYRYSQKGPPISVSGDERAAFIAAFRRDIWRVFWLFALLMIVMLVGGVVFLVLHDVEVHEGWAFGLIAAAILPYRFGYLYIWRAPRRALANRAAHGFERSGDEMRKIWAARTTWQQLAVAAGALAVLGWSIATKYDVLHGWGRLWILLGAGIVGVMVWSVVNKLRAGRAE